MLASSVVHVHFHNVMPWEVPFAMVIVISNFRKPCCILNVTSWTRNTMCRNLRRGRLSIPEASELSVVLCDDAHIQALNQEWRKKDAATDVLSFPMDDDMPEGYPARILGDVVISLDTAQRQAQERGCDSIIIFRLQPYASRWHTGQGEYCISHCMRILGCYYKLTYKALMIF